MGYYNDDYYDEYGDYVEPVNLISGPFSEEILVDILASVGLTDEAEARYVCTMERLVFMHGEPTEVYSPAEIRFIKKVEKVLVYPDFLKKLNREEMVCRTIVTKLDSAGNDAIRACIAFEKITNKALDGFNIFLFITDDSLFWGCRLFDKTKVKDCVLSVPITSQIQFEQYLDELYYLSKEKKFTRYYNRLNQLITSEYGHSIGYEEKIAQRRGVHISYIEDMKKFEQDTGISTEKERERYLRSLYEKPEESFAFLIQDVEEGLAFIKSTRVNSFEILFEAEEAMQQAEEAEKENLRMVENKYADQQKSKVIINEETENLLDDPEELIKFLKRKRGL